MFNWLTLKHYIRRIKGIRADIIGNDIFKQYLPELYRDKFFQRYRKELKGGSMYVGVDLLPEIKLQFKDPFELKNEENRRLAMEVSRFNEVFAKHGLLELVKMHPQKYDDEKFYGFIVELMFNYTNLTVKSVSYVIFYSLFLLGILGTAIYFTLLYLL